MKKNIFIILGIVFLTSSYCQASMVGDSLAADSAAAFQTGRDSDMGSHFYKVFLITGILLFVLVGGLYVFKKISAKSSFLNKSKIRILARQSIGPKQFVVLVSIEENKYALGVTDHAVNLLAELGEMQEEDSLQQNASPPALNFANLLTRLKKEK